MMRRRSAQVASWLASVVERRPLLEPAVHLGIAGVQVQRHRRRRHQAQLPVDLLADLGQLGHRRLALASVQAPHQLPRRGRRWRLAHRSQLCPGLVLAQLLQVHQVVAAHCHHLGQRHQQLAGAAASPSSLEGTDGVDDAVQSRHHVGAGGQLPGQEQAGMASQGRVVGPNLDVAGTLGTMHRTGVLPNLVNWA
jgi:hypothetical protein